MVVQEEKVSKVLERFGTSIKEVDVNLSVSKGKGGEKHKCEITVFMLRMGVVHSSPSAPVLCTF